MIFSDHNNNIVHQTKKHKTHKINSNDNNNKEHNFQYRFILFSFIGIYILLLKSTITTTLHD
eukprot:UN10093